MNDAKYIGMDVHQATICAAVRDSSGNLVMEATLETKAETILEFVRGLRGSLRVSFEEGTCASWWHDLLQPHVSEVLVCDSRKNALLRVGNKNDREDARKLSELLFLNKLHSVYHGETGIRTLKELARSYLTITRDLTRLPEVWSTSPVFVGVGDYSGVTFNRCSELLDFDYRWRAELNLGCLHPATRIKVHLYFADCKVSYASFRPE